MARASIAFLLLAALAAAQARELSVFIDSEPVQTSIPYDPAFPATGKQLPFSDARLVSATGGAHAAAGSIAPHPTRLRHTRRPGGLCEAGGGVRASRVARGGGFGRGVVVMMLPASQG